MTQETKVCSKCKLEKSVEFFWKRKDRPIGYRPACKECSSSYHSEWHFQNKDSVRKRSICKRYSLSSSQYDEMMTRGCDSCGSFSDLCIDHNHSCCNGEFSCGKCIRGILCRGCNIAEGWLNSDPQKAILLARYMEKFL